MALTVFGSRFFSPSDILAAAPGSCSFSPARRGRHGQTYNRLFKQIKQLGRFAAVGSTEVAIAAPPRQKTKSKDEPAHIHGRGHPQDLSRFLRVQGPHGGALELAGAGQRPDADVHQLGHGPVQGRVPGRRQAQLRARRLGPGLPARRRQAQRPGERGLHRAPPHLLRDAGQLELRRLLQARIAHLGLRAADQGLQAAGREALGHRLHRGRRGLRHLDEGNRPAARARRAHRRQQGRALHVRQLLDDGRHRPVRPVLRDLLRPRPRDPRRPARLA
jgi:hypothetical protein